MIRTNEVQGQQRRMNDRENMTGFHRADTFMQRVGSVICSILMLICMISGIVKGISSIIGVLNGKNGQPDNNYGQDQGKYHHREKQQRW